MGKMRKGAYIALEGHELYGLITTFCAALVRV